MKPIDIALLVVLALPAFLASCASPSSTEAAHARRIAELETQCATLRDRLAELEERVQHPPVVIQGVDIDGVDPHPAIDAHVLVVDRDQGMVTLDKGKKDGVEAGYVFTAYRGSEYKGQVRVLEVQESTSSARIVAEKAPITSGDSATTSL